MANDLPTPVFVVDFKFNGRGELFFGEIPDCRRDITFWSSGAGEIGPWKLAITSYAVVGTEDGTKLATGRLNITAALGTGTRFLLLPLDVVQNYYAKVPGCIYQDGEYYVPTNQSLPDLVLYIGEEAYPVEIKGEYLQLHPHGPPRNDLRK